MINLIQSPCTSHTYRELLTHADGYGVGDDGGEESLKIPLSGVENRINQPPKMKIMVAVALSFTKNSVLLAW
jgi:hypothetical protein